MKAKLIYLILMIVFLSSFGSIHGQEKETITKSVNLLIGKYVRIGPTGAVGLDFKDNGLVEVDFGNDQTVDVVTQYELQGDTIKFTDKDGKMCQGSGLYEVYLNENYLSFDLIDDDCGGRIKTTMGFWTKPNFMDLVKKLDDEITKSPNAELYLNRARVFMATGMVKKAKEDFDKYLLTDTLNSKVYINRAGTRFPNDLSGVIDDCNKAISLDPDDKNAYFLRGLARYELGEKEKGCEDFSKAIELGFSALRIAEKEKCIDYWNKN